MEKARRRDLALTYAMVMAEARRQAALPRPTARSRREADVRKVRWWRVGTLRSISGLSTLITALVFTCLLLAICLLVSPWILPDAWARLLCRWVWRSTGPTVFVVSKQPHQRRLQRCAAMKSLRSSNVTTPAAVRAQLSCAASRGAAPGRRTCRRSGTRRSPQTSWRRSRAQSLPSLRPEPPPSDGVIPRSRAAVIRRLASSSPPADAELVS